MCASRRRVREGARICSPRCIGRRQFVQTNTRLCRLYVHICRGIGITLFVSFQGVVAMLLWLGQHGVGILLFESQPHYACTPCNGQRGGWLSDWVKLLPGWQSPPAHDGPLCKPAVTPFEALCILGMLRMYLWKHIRTAILRSLNAEPISLYSLCYNLSTNMLDTIRGLKHCGHRQWDFQRTFRNIINKFEHGTTIDNSF